MYLVCSFLIYFRLLNVIAKMMAQLQHSLINQLFCRKCRLFHSWLTGLIVVFVLSPVGVSTQQTWTQRPPPTQSPWQRKRSRFSATWTSSSSLWLSASSFIGSCPVRSLSPSQNSRSLTHREYPSCYTFLFR